MFSHLNKTIVLGDVTLSLSDFQELEPEYRLPKGYKGQLLNQDGYFLINKKGEEEFQRDTWQPGLDYYAHRYVYLAKVNAAKPGSKANKSSGSMLAVLEILSLPPTERQQALLAVNPPPSLEILTQGLRLVRNKRLQESDYTQLPDSPTLNKSEWAAYRQLLRDLPTEGHPLAIKWPQAPA